MLVYRRGNSLDHTSMQLHNKQKAPAFVLTDQNEKEHSLKKYLGKWVALYFYPKDDTPGCTAEACGFRDYYTKLKRAGIVILGVSADPVKNHKKFAEKYSLSFPLLADVEKAVVTQYGVLRTKQFMGREYIGISRTTFLIDPTGKIAKIYEDIKPDDHAKEILADTKTLLKKK